MLKDVQVLFLRSTNLLMMILDGFWPERCAVLKEGGRRAWKQCSRIWKEDLAPQRDDFIGFTAEQQEELLEED